MARAARVFMLAALAAATVASGESFSDVGPPADYANVSVQIVNPDVQTAIRVSLDSKVIFDGLPSRSSLSNIPTAPSVAGPFVLATGSRHALVAEVPATNIKAQLQWSPRLDGGAWVVIHYYPGRSEPATPPFFTFSIQANSHKLR